MSEKKELTEEEFLELHAKEGLYESPPCPDNKKPRHLYLKCETGIYDAIGQALTKKK